MSFFGPIKTGWEVEQAVIAHLRRWETTYLAEMERQGGHEPRFVTPAESYTTTPAEDGKWPERSLPAILVVTLGTIDKPEREGDGTVRARWRIGIGTVDAGATEDGVHRLAKLRFAAIRGAMLQHPSLGGFAAGTDWEGKEYDTFAPEKQRALASAYGLFAIEVTDVLNTHAGLLEPPSEPYELGSPTTFQEVGLDAQRFGPSDEFDDGS